MNAFRTRLNVLGLERRDMPSATLGAAIGPLPPTAAAYDLQVNRKFSDDAAGVSEVQRITLGGSAQSEPTALVSLDSRPGSGVLKGADTGAGPHIKAFGANAEATAGKAIGNVKWNDIEIPRSSGGGAGKVSMQDIHFAASQDVIYVSTAGGGVWKTTNGGR